jgi:hypothetical protein
MQNVHGQMLNLLACVTDIFPFIVNTLWENVEFLKLEPEAAAHLSVRGTARVERRMAGLRAAFLRTKMILFCDNHRALKP